MFWKLLLHLHLYYCSIFIVTFLVTFLVVHRHTLKLVHTELLSCFLHYVPSSWEQLKCSSKTRSTKLANKSQNKHFHMNTMCLHSCKSQRKQKIKKNSRILVTTNINQNTQSTASDYSVIEMKCISRSIFVFLFGFSETKVFLIVHFYSKTVCD